jgi:hypothetical protein
VELPEASAKAERSHVELQRCVRGDTKKLVAQATFVPRCAGMCMEQQRARLASIATQISCLVTSLSGGVCHALPTSCHRVDCSVEEDSRLPPPRELWLVIDGSGSMGGAPEVQARDAASFFVKDLPQNKGKLFEYGQHTLWNSYAHEGV